MSTGSAEPATDHSSPGLYRGIRDIAQFISLVCDKPSYIYHIVICIKSCNLVMNTDLTARFFLLFRRRARQ